MATVIGPTPPGTGVIRDATFEADSKSTSPTNFTRLSVYTKEVPASTTIAPFLICLPEIIPGFPTAEIITSAEASNTLVSLVLSVTTETVIPEATNMRANGLPTKSPATRSKTCLPLSEILYHLSSSKIAAGVGGKNNGSSEDRRD